MTVQAKRFEVWIADDAGSVDVRSMIITTTGEKQAFKIAQSACSDGEFVRCVHEIEDEPANEASKTWDASTSQGWRYMTQDEEKEIYGYVEGS